MHKNLHKQKLLVDIIIKRFCINEELKRKIEETRPMFPSYKDINNKRREAHFLVQVKFFDNTITNTISEGN